MKILGTVRFKLLFLSLLVVFVITSIIVWSDIEDTKERLIAAQKEKAVLLSDTIKQSIKCSSCLKIDGKNYRHS